MSAAGTTRAQIWTRTRTILLLLAAIFSSTMGCRTPARLGSLPGLGWLGNKDGQAAALASEDPTAAYPPPSAASVPSPLTNNVASTDSPATEKQAGLAAPESYPSTGFPSVELPAADSAAPASLSGSAGSMAATPATATGGGLTPPAGSAEAFPSYPPSQTASTGVQPQQGFYGSPGPGAVPSGTMPTTPPPAGNALATANPLPSSHPYQAPTTPAHNVSGDNMGPAHGAAPNSPPVGGPWPNPPPSSTARGGYGAAPANLSANVNAGPNAGSAIGGYAQSSGFATGSTSPSTQVSHEQPILPNGPVADSFSTATNMAGNPWRPGSTSDYEAAATVANTAQPGFSRHVPGTAGGAYGGFSNTPPSAAPAGETGNRASVWR